MMIRCTSFFFCCVMLLAPYAFAQEFVQPNQHIVENQGVSKKVTCGTVFESGRLNVDKDVDVVVPKGAVVEEYAGDEVQFYLTKSLHCVGHPPAPMHLKEIRGYFGIAYQKSDEKIVVATFGEWINKGGTATIKMLVRVPRGVTVKQIAKLAGEESVAATKRDLGDQRLEEAYWYSGIEPKAGWHVIATELHQNRFLNPEE